jgi:hypothetical protein
VAREAAREGGARLVLGNLERLLVEDVRSDGEADPVADDAHDGVVHDGDVEGGGPVEGGEEGLVEAGAVVDVLLVAVKDLHPALEHAPLLLRLLVHLVSPRLRHLVGI